jgi:hypothetical protein
MEFSGLTDDQQERLEKFLRRQSNIFFSHLAFLNTTNQRLQLVLEDRGALKGRFVASRTTPNSMKRSDLEVQSNHAPR